MSWLFFVNSAVKPKWYRALTKSGKPAGLGFECPKCHLCFAHDAPEKIFHCGAQEKQPRFTALLPERRIGGEPALPSNFFQIGAW